MWLAGVLLVVLASFLLQMSVEPTWQAMAAVGLVYAGGFLLGYSAGRGFR